MSHDDPMDIQRVAKRVKTFETAKLVRGGTEQRMHLLNLSESGALCHSDTPPLAGESITILLSGQSLNGRTIWSQDKKFGVAFNTPLNVTQMTALIPPTDKIAG